MKDFKEYRDKRIQDWKKQKHERLQLRNSKSSYNFVPVSLALSFKFSREKL